MRRSDHRPEEVFLTSQVANQDRLAATVLDNLEHSSDHSYLASGILLLLAAAQHRWGRTSPWTVS